MGHLVPEEHILWGLLDVILPTGRSSSELTTSQHQNSTHSFATSAERSQDEFDDGIF